LFTNWTKSNICARTAVIAVGCAMSICSVSTSALSADAPVKMSPEAEKVPFDPKVFRQDPQYKNQPYSAPKQIEIYGGKTRMDEPRPLLELGREIYKEGPYKEGYNLIGRKNMVDPALSVYGDFRAAFGYNKKGDQDQAILAAQLNLDVDLKLTGTERIHAFFRPLDKGGQFTSIELFGFGKEDQPRIELDADPETLFFEGDMGSIVAGLTDEYQTFDFPFSIGFMPLVYQNGIWMDDNIIGGAFAIPALNSPMLDISNMDISIFAGFDRVTTQAIKDSRGDNADHNVDIYGIATFIEANEGYWEAGFGFIDGESDFQDLDYYSATVAFTRRYFGKVSNSVRFLAAFGQDRDNNAQQTADGQLLLFESSLITSLPSTLVPYLNMFAGFDRPRQLADDNGPLKNTGINFEADALSLFPNLDDTGHDTWGGALGVQYLFNLDQQLVVEVATVQIIGDANEPGRAAKDDQYGFGIRYQRPISPTWIVRLDGMYGLFKDNDDIAGARLEFRRKF
jgi:hypothetical protein